MNDRLLHSNFESFNARVLSFSQVAHTFVPSQNYEKLAKRGHTLLIGPRGSGKTTLLKMLQQPALEVWKHPEADHYRNSIDFTGIFIPTDIGWNEQLRSLGNDHLDPAIHRLLSVATFTTHVLRATVTSILNRVTAAPKSDISDILRPFRRVKLAEENETALARSFCEMLHLKRTVPSLIGIKQGLSMRIAEIKEIAGREALVGDGNSAARLSGIRFLHLHFVQAAATLIELFEDAAHLSPAKWALAFDELELAPEWIQEQLGGALRSTEPRFLFKLALSPFSSSQFLREDALAARSNEDFEQIPLWYRTKREATEFCASLWKAMIEREGGQLSEPREVLGPSYFELSDGEPAGEAYGPDSRTARIFERLARHDDTFAAYLELNKIKPSRLKQLSSPKRSANVRKIAPLVVVREFYKAADRLDSVQQRSRKSPTLYAGANSVFSISEGNPRWFIALVTKLLLRWRHRDKQIESWVQAEEIERAAQAFSALIKTIPVSHSATSSMGVLGIVKVVGQHFHAGVVNEPFSDDPPLTFTVDSFVKDDVTSVLSQALNAGALVYIPEKASDNLILTSLRGKRFRISYLLAPTFKLPLRLGRSVALSKVIKPLEVVKPPSTYSFEQLRLIETGDE